MRRFTFLALLTAGFASPARPATTAPAPAGVVSHVSVVSDKVPDVSSLEAWQKSFIKEGMSDQQKALAVWDSVVRFKHQDAPPLEYLAYEDCVHDAIKTMNVYGYGMCCCASSMVESLCRYVGLQARGRQLAGHSVPEIFWDGEWHMLDTSLINYFPKPDGKIASVDEIAGAVRDWLAKNPQVRGKLDDFMRADGWMGYKKGPELLANCPFYNMGWWPAGTHGWSSTMSEYGQPTQPMYEYGYTQGYQVNLQLRPGERLTRNWSNQGLHVNLEGGGDAPGCLKTKVGENDLKYAPKYGDIAPGRIGNGLLEYDVPLASGAFRSGALAATNLACKAEDKKSPAVHVKDASQTGVLEIRMPSSYVYLDGTASLQAVVPAGGQITALLSDNNGLDWKEVAKITTSGAQTLDLRPLVFRRYDYRLRLALKGKGTGLDALRFTHHVQHSQRALPALAQGRNTITFSAGPQEGTITIEASTNPDNKGKNLIAADFHPVLDNVAGKYLRPQGGKGSFTFPIATPGEMTRLRLGAYYRCRDAKDHWDVAVSFDGGKEFKPVAQFAGPTGFGTCRYLTYADVPAGSKQALVRFSGVEVNTTCINAFRIDADYKEPAGGFRPVQITYAWEEGGIEKRDVHKAVKPEESYTIECASAPVMKSISLELAGAGPAAAPAGGGPVSVRVLGRDRFEVNGEAVSGLAGLRATVRKAGASAAQVEAGKEVPFAALVPVLDALKAAGAVEINVSLRVK